MQTEKAKTISIEKHILQSSSCWCAYSVLNRFKINTETFVNRKVEFYVFKSSIFWDFYFFNRRVLKE